MHKENWDDLRFVLAVADLGSVSKAAKHLGVNHATVLRRVASYEEQLGTVLFERTAHGYQVLTDKRDVFAAAREAEDALRAVQNLGGHARPLLSGTVRVTSTDTFCHSILPEIAAQLQSQTNQLFIELLSTNAHVDLGRLQADITVRPAQKLEDDLIGEQAAIMGFSAYMSRTLSPEKSNDWITLVGPLSRSQPANWMSKSIPQSACVAAADSFQTLCRLAVAGLGCTFLPSFIGDAAPELKRLETQAPEMTVPIWVASHSDLAQTPRIRALRAQLSACLTDRADILRGKP
ncbi:LysR family transcriptional regulator [Falsihalocynthiibacter arcticus]|uniref:HTH lysR-type domain-containing protein n=1 Tax=Falsihalocynthiibacter arcticus TaxID=1579316 RepID=A0A126V453_9RHOB|nr:LysR family transcriptional regulator [Falsihalocynthiibacter arcticus]AML52735.1 hypothetical protein RC74_17015 [Falsihalocynthiibacter arcticus]